MATLCRNMFGPIRGDGPEAALEQAREAAGSRDISIGGAASTAQQYLRRGLIDEMEIHVVPTLLGEESGCSKISTAHPRTSSRSRS